jgi:hypothetical protein
MNSGIARYTTAALGNVVCFVTQFSCGNEKRRSLAAPFLLMLL